MNGRRWWKGLKIVLMVIAAVAVFGFVVRGLWNWLMPPLFGWHVITFWQAAGLLLLSKILFGGFRGRPGFGRGGMRWRGRMAERWEQMSPEERAKFSAGMRGRCGPWGFAGGGPGFERGFGPRFEPGMGQGAEEGARQG